MFIIYVTTGEYSAYSISGVWLGDVDPTPILDAHVAKLSGGTWASVDQMEKDNSGEYRKTEDKKDAIRSTFVAALTDAGFKQIQAVEVWLG